MLFALAFAGFLLAGCTSNNTSPTGNNSAPVIGAGTPGLPSTPGIVAPPADPKADVARLLRKMNSTAWMVEYSVDSGGSSAFPFTGMSAYRDGTGSYRYDMSVQTMDVRMYHLQTDAPGAGVACLKNSTMNWTCVKANSSMTDIFGSMTDNLTQAQIASLPSKTIAGVAASCYNVTNQTGSSLWSEACFSPTDGAILYAGGASKQSDGSISIGSFTATTYSNSVSDSDFIPPSTPIDPGAYSGGQ